MEPSVLFKELKRLAPSVAYTTEVAVDHDFVWDGDGPDPVEKGFQAYDAWVHATKIVDGEEVEESVCLGGVYMKSPNESPDFHGYLTGMLKDVTDQMLKAFPTDAQLLSASTFIGYALSSEYTKSLSKTKGVEVCGTLQVGQGKLRKLYNVIAIAPHGKPDTIDLSFVSAGKNVGLTTDRESVIKMIARIKDELNIP